MTPDLLGEGDKLKVLTGLEMLRIEAKPFIMPILTGDVVDGAC